MIRTHGWRGSLVGMPREGASAERSKHIDVRDMCLFPDMTGDGNPLHLDKEVARGVLFGRLIVQCGVTSGLLNALIAEDLPGPGSVFLNVNWRVVKPVCIGDTITARVEVTRVRGDEPICELVTTVRNQNGETCLSGSAETYTVAVVHP